MLNVQITGDKELIARLDAMQDNVRAALFKKVWSLSAKLENKIKNEKLSGQVLNVVSGALRRSIGSDVEQDGSKVIGKAIQSGDVKYGAAHEFGFEGDVTVAAHTREVDNIFGREVDPRTQFIKAFTRHVKMPEKSFMRSSLNDMREEIIKGLTEAVRKGLETP